LNIIYRRLSDDTPDLTKKLDNLLKLFSKLIVKTSGNVSNALEIIKILDDKYGIFDDNFTFDDFINYLKEKGMIIERNNGFALTSLASVRIRRDIFNEIFGKLRNKAEGQHELFTTGMGVEKTHFTRKYRFGDHIYNIDHTQTLTNVFIKNGIDKFFLKEDDIEIYETEQQTSVSSVLLIDISHSMILYGEDRITPAKLVAVALAELILSRYKHDTLDVVVFGDDARNINISDIPFIEAGPYHTNTKAALDLARNILHRKKNTNKQIFMITDGKPSAIYENINGIKKLYKNSWGLDPKIINKTLDEAVICRRQKINITTFMLSDDPYLLNFIDTFTEANNGKAYYCDLNNLGEYIIKNYIRNKLRFED
jgi:uncharacterized protein with von Willebrand factor type A (vWA) domain